MKEIEIKGIIPAAVLPMTAEYEPDYDAFAHYLEWLISENAVALAVNMDTGEGPQLKPAERRRALEVAVGVAKGHCGVVAGVMGTTTMDAVENARMAHQAGADALVVFPNAAFRNEPLDWRIPYNYHHAIAKESGLPIILFQLAPVFGGVNYTRETLLRLLEIPEVIGIKEASFDPRYFAYTRQTLNLADRSIILLTGNDRFITESFLLGAEGALLGFCAVGCRLVAEMLAAFQQENFKAAVAMRYRVQGLADLIYQDPVLDYRARCKAALSILGIIDRDRTFVRPPLLPVSDKEFILIADALRTAGM